MLNQLSLTIYKSVNATYLIKDHEDRLQDGPSRLGVRHLLLDVGEADEDVSLGHAPEQSLEGDNARALDHARRYVEFHTAVPLVRPGVDQVRLVDVYEGGQELLVS